uniref:Uncharacterized protein n=1 Tax=Arundo donax TaxID=35708 RepID=A0A0A8Z826_ARUDO
MVGHGPRSAPLIVVGGE